LWHSSYVVFLDDLIGPQGTTAETG
jgi:hypothetical protein